MHEVDAGLVLQHLAREMRLAAAAVGRVVDRARLRLRECDQLGERIGRQRRIGDQQLLQQHQHRDRDEVALGIVGKLCVEMRIDGERGIGRQQHRATVGSGARDGLGRDDGVGAGTVFHHDRLAPFVAQLLADEPPRTVDAAAGRERHHDGNGLGWVVLRLRSEGECQDGRKQKPHADARCL